MDWAVAVLVSGLMALGLVKSQDEEEVWKCPDIPKASCSCDLPYTLRCTGKPETLDMIATSLVKNHRPYYVSLLDLSIQGLQDIRVPILQGVAVQGLVITSGELKWIGPETFRYLKQPLEALGLPNNLITAVPTLALSSLKALLRLDLSQNSLSYLNEVSFKELSSLRFIDLSGNRLRNISKDTFLEVPFLKTLQLNENYLTTPVITQLKGLANLEKLDLSRNSISGPLKAATLPRMSKLVVLNMAHNHISSITKDSLSGLDSLKVLSLQNNMIDVLEDHAFSNLNGLSSLDLSHNRIVAVSENSLAHLEKLDFFDSSHNYLRAITKEIISPLSNLKELRLDDNDISMIAKDALEGAKHLKILTLSENPLNCDCNLAYFAEWLQNSTLKTNDKNTAICATPPTLENAFVNELSLNQLVCASDDDLPVNFFEPHMPLSGSRVTLQGFNYDGKKAYFLWRIDTLEFYYCDSLYVYEELGTHEILLEHNRLNCNASDLRDPHILPVTMETQHLQTGHKYRYCLVMVEKNDAEASLILGCSDILTLSINITPQIISLKANMTSSNVLSVHAQVWPQNIPCFIKFYLSLLSKKYKKKKVNCTDPSINLKGLPEEEPLKICAAISDLMPYCIWIYPKQNPEGSKGNKFSLLMMFLFILAFSVILIILYRWLKHLLNRPKLHEQCFLASPQEEGQHSNYVKLQATTKL